jgi:hypothetical protein
VTRERLKTLVAEYGRLALATYFGLFIVVLSGFALAISWGVDVTSATGSVGVWGAAYIATKAVQPLRIAATLALTPLLAHALRKYRGKSASASVPDEEKLRSQQQDSSAP